MNAATKGDLEDALNLRPGSDGCWLAFADPRYESLNGMFGGWIAAMLLHAAMKQNPEGSPSALSVAFLGKVTPGTDLTVRVQRLGDTRSVQHWRGELAGPDGQLAAHANIVFAARRESDGFTEPRMPTVPPPDGLEEVHPPGPHGQRVLQRPIAGYPPFRRDTTSSLAWTRELSGRPVDHLRLVILSDTFAPRIFFVSDGPRPSATITLGIHFLATEPELKAVGDDYVLSEVVGTRAAHSTVGSQARFWSRQGVLLATSEQLCWYR